MSYSNIRNTYLHKLPAARVNNNVLHWRFYIYIKQDSQISRNAMVYFESSEIGVPFYAFRLNYPFDLYVMNYKGRR